jgi:hypothetical protein
VRLQKLRKDSRVQSRTTVKYRNYWHPAVNLTLCAGRGILSSVLLSQRHHFARLPTTAVVSPCLHQ